MLSRKDTHAARGLGWASLVIGFSEIVAPRAINELLGIDDHPRYRGVLRVLGAREIMHGLGILADKKPTRSMTVGLWSRVLGDTLDTALLGVAATKTKRPGRFATVAAMVMGIGLLDMLYAKRLSTGRGRA
jgi:hypothetical protein